ncbi:hypothetical protein CERSUDRAFT_133902 [Gelatoporia subvermispora B]|uniref:Uncharacterized protein n=1 Tax=Ceriporiopsis subvermispora (strain B) TaxID=914234 RepID=M2RJU9_CERS8|nr:hypothetical protein CERSUDRAFT_133902 [Gelatoporia subvermispora B]
MRQRMEDLTEYCPLPTLFRLSAFGTRMCFYYRNIGDGPAVIKPQCIPWNPDIVTDTAPKERWDYDILHPDGEEKLREIVNMIQEAYRSAK